MWNYTLLSRYSVYHDMQCATNHDTMCITIYGVIPIMIRYVSRYESQNMWWSWLATCTTHNKIKWLCKELGRRCILTNYKTHVVFISRNNWWTSMNYVVLSVLNHDTDFYYHTIYHAKKELWFTDRRRVVTPLVQPCHLNYQWSYTTHEKCTRTHITTATYLGIFCFV